MRIKAAMMMAVVHLLVVEVSMVPLESKEVSALSVAISLLYLGLSHKHVVFLNDMIKYVSKGGLIDFFGFLNVHGSNDE